MMVFSMRPLRVIVASYYLKELMLERSPLNVVNVINLFHNAKLQIHERAYTGEKHYECTECGKFFAYHDHLQVPKRTHTGKKFDTCNQCDKAFLQNSNLHVHQRTHAGEKHYQQSQCAQL